MKRLLIILYICLVGLLAVTTFVEQANGTDFVERNIYHASWFCCLWGVIAVLTFVALIRRALWRRLPILLFHGSLLVILVGAMITFMSSEKGYIHLVPGTTVNSFQEPESGRNIDLPFTVQLDSFRIEYYPGTEAPADYVSYITYSPTGQKNFSSHERISMNRIFTAQGFRFYQSSFDEDQQGSWLSVNYDPWGTSVTYAGYILLGISMLWLLFSRSGEFRRLLNHPLLKKGSVFILFLLCLAGATQAQTQAPKKLLPALKRVQADSLAREQVIYHDRVVPFNTLACDFIQKLTGETSYKGLTPEQIIGGWLLYPEVWRNEPFIYIKNAELRHLLNLPTSYARLTDLFDGSVYRLQKHWQREQGKQSKLAKAIQETDEKVGLILMLEKGTFIHPLPADGSVQPLSEQQVKAELLYNHIPFSKILFMVNLTAGILAFLLLLYNSLRRNTLSPKTPKVSRIAETSFSVALYAAFIFHLAGYCLRWYIGGRIPLSNGYETMQFMALCILLVACLLHRKFPFMLPFGFQLSGFALLVSYLGQMNPQITPLMPVLVSPWLSIHVSLIMMSYALFAFIMLNGILALCHHRQNERVEQLTILSRLLLYPAVFFLGAGIFLGAVWANVSWGRYWAWDPKEVWALITFLVYGAAFHSQSLRIFRKPLFFHIYMIIAFLTVLMTYFGVNYVLGGMHSYANG